MVVLPERQEAEIYRFLYLLQKHEIHIKLIFFNVRGKEDASCNRFISFCCESRRCWITWEPWVLWSTSSWWSFAARRQRRSAVPCCNHLAWKEELLVVGSSRHWRLFTDGEIWGWKKSLYIYHQTHQTTSRTHQPMKQEWLPNLNLNDDWLPN